MKKFNLLLIVLCLSACSKSGSGPAPVPNATANSIASIAASALAAAGSCTGVDAIQADLANELAKLPLLSSSAAQLKSLSAVGSEKGIGASLCVPAVQLVLPMILGLGLNQIPASWKCSGDLASSGLSSLAAKACSAIPF